MTPNSNPTNGQAPSHPSGKRVGDAADEWDSRSITKAYHRMEAREASPYVDRLRRESPGIHKSKVELEKLEDNERQIMKCRDRLGRNPSTRGLQKELQELFEKWRDEPDIRTGDKKPFKSSWENRQTFVKPTICTGPGNGEREVEDKDDPAHDMNAYFMFFKREGEEWKGEDYHKGRFPQYEHFPNQRISVHDALYDDEHNPFNPAFDDDKDKPRLRYIHIPANHMGVSQNIFACGKLDIY